MGLDWQRDGRDWPHRDASHFECAAGLRWHVQLMTPPAARPLDGRAAAARTEAPAAAVFAGPPTRASNGETAPVPVAAAPSGQAASMAPHGVPASVPAGVTAARTPPAVAVDAAPPAGDAPALPPLVLLIHGTGASTHSWRALMPLLAQRCSVVAVDLPGHGFTATPAGGAFSHQFTLPGMAEALARLLRTPLLASLQPPPAGPGAPGPAGPALVVGHSAGAAIAARLCLDGHIAPRAVVSLNGAFLPLGGVAGQLFSPVAKLAALLPFVPQLFSWRASDRDVLRQLVDGTGSVLDADGVAYYAKLAANPGHIAGALAMMANWDLQTLTDDLPRLRTPLALMVGSRDRTIAPEQAPRVRARLPAPLAPAIVTFDGLGHLAHEEQPARIADAVWQVAREVGLPGAG